MYCDEGSERFLSSRVRDIRPSGIRAFFDMNAVDGDIISLGVGEPDFITPEKVREACIQALRDGKTKYTSNRGMIELREELSTYYSSSFAVTCDPEQEIIVTVGSSEAVDLALRTSRVDSRNVENPPVHGYVRPYDCTDCCDPIPTSWNGCQG